MTSTRSYRFNPFEVSICGYSGLGKTTMLCRLIQSLSKRFVVGYVKHDAHRFEMDKEGKDTYLARKNGASGVAIYNTDTLAYIGSRQNQALTRAFVDYDLVLIEGLKSVPNIPKIVFLDTDNHILEDIDSDSILLTITPDQRDDIDRIERAVLTYFEKKVKEMPLYGLVLTGGMSKRMGSDKSLLDYHGMPQYQHGYQLLNQVCDQTYISCRSDQKNLYKDYPVLLDAFLNMGPLGGILTAQKTHPQAAWFVIACDLPFLNNDLLKYIKAKRNPYRLATACDSSINGLPEPLAAIYEPKSYMSALQLVAEDRFCPRKLLLTSNTMRLSPLNDRVLQNINSLLDYEGVKGDKYESN